MNRTLILIGDAPEQQDESTPIVFYLEDGAGFVDDGLTTPWLIAPYEMNGKLMTSGNLSPSIPNGTNVDISVTVASGALQNFAVHLINGSGGTISSHSFGDLAVGVHSINVTVGGIVAKIAFSAACNNTTQSGSISLITIIEPSTNTLVNSTDFSSGWSNVDNAGSVNWFLNVDAVAPVGSFPNDVTDWARYSSFYNIPSGAIVNGSITFNLDLGVQGVLYVNGYDGTHEEIWNSGTITGTGNDVTVTIPNYTMSPGNTFGLIEFYFIRSIGSGNITVKELLVEVQGAVYTVPNGNFSGTFSDWIQSGSPGYAWTASVVGGTDNVALLQIPAPAFGLDYNYQGGTGASGRAKRTGLSIPVGTYRLLLFYDHASSTTDTQLTFECRNGSVVIDSVVQTLDQDSGLIDVLVTLNAEVDNVRITATSLSGSGIFLIVNLEFVTAIVPAEPEEPNAVDLSPGTIISTTYKFLEIGDLTSRYATFTNQFKLPWTYNNKQQYQHLYSVKSRSRIPYIKKDGYRIIQNGVEILRDGIGIVKKSFETLNLEIFAGVFGFFDAITDRQLTDLNYLDQNEEPSQVSADNRRANSTNIVFPVIQWGNSLHSVGGQVYNYLPPVGGQYPHLPCFYYFDIMNRIFSEAGYTKSGSIFSNDKYLRTIVTVGNDELYQYSDKFRLAKELLALSPEGQLMVDPAVETNVIFDRVITSGSDNFYNGTDTYTVANPDTNNQYFSGKFRVKLFLSTTGGTINIKAYYSGSFNVFATNVTGGNSYEFEVDPCPMKHGDELRVTIIKNTGNPTVTVVGGSIQFTEADGVATEYIYYNEVLPRLSQKDFIADFCVRFGQIPKPVGKNIIFKSLNEIISDRANAYNWTSKRIKRPDETEYVYDDYAQRNIYRYSKSDNTTEITGQGQFDIDNENLDDEIAEEFDFQSSLQTIEAGGLATVNIGVYDSDNPGSSTEEQEYDRAPGNRILLVRDWITEASVVFQNDAFKPGYNTPRTGYKIAYFDDPKYANTCSYQQSIDDHYSSLVKALQELEVIIRYYDLSELDIAMLDPHKLMFDDGNYFIILAVNNFVPGIVTKVELLKVG